MRYHNDWALAQAWAHARGLNSLCNPEHLVVARLESVARKNLPGLALDIRLQSDDKAMSIPCIYVDELALLTKLRDVLIWPELITSIASDDQLYALERALYPWIEFAVTGRGVIDECFHLFKEGDAAQTFRDARAQGLFGAVSLAHTSESLLMAHYVGRFASGSCLAASSQHLNTAALLNPFVISTIFPDLSNTERRIAEAWFGTSFLERSPDNQRVNLVVGSSILPRIECADTVRTIDQGFSRGGHQLQYVPARALDDLTRLGENVDDLHRFTASATEQTLPQRVHNAPTSFGGSSGKVVFALRRQVYEDPGADLDEATALATCLKAEGFDVELRTLDHPDCAAGADIIHAFGLADPEPLQALLQRAKVQGIPTVVSSLFEDTALEGRWGARASRSLLNALDDEAELERTLFKLAQRQVEVDGMTANTRHDDGHDRLRTEILRKADVVIVSSLSEREALQRFSGRRRRTLEVPSLLYRTAVPEPIAHLVPDGPFILLHASAEARANLGLAMRALRALALPVVVISCPVDRRLYRVLQANAPLASAILPFVTSGQAEAIYSRATVFVDVAWYGEGVYRSMRALAHGAELVVARNRHLPACIESLVSRVDPASGLAIQSGIAQAWQRGLDPVRATQRSRDDSWHEPSVSLRAYAQVYAQASERLGHRAEHS